LSRAQTASVILALLKKNPQYKFVFRAITTLGDRVKHWDRNAKGIFVKELEDALYAGRIDMAVHSVKDLPAQLPKDLRLAAVTRREEPRDVLITRDDKAGGLAGIKPGSVVGTSSLRRRAQILRARPDLIVTDLRGNLDTRLGKLKSASFDAIVVAAAGLKRLKCGFHRSWILPEMVMLPAAGQGALGVQVRKNDSQMMELAGRLDDPATRSCVDCERAFLRRTGAGCRMPVAAFAQIRKNRIFLEALVISLDGKRAVRLNCSGKIGEAESIGRDLARKILKNGGKEILREIENGSS
jgi:hydroxymethylbilane synthase